MTAQETMDGSPALVEEEHISIKFQAGPIRENRVNGTTIERVTELLIRRLEGFQRGPFECEENAQAILAYKDALGFLEQRTSNRREQGVEGKNEPHSS